MARKPISRRAMLPLAGLGLLAAGGALLTPGSAHAQRHPRIRTAITDLKDVRQYLKDSAIGFGGHKKKAIEAVSEAIDQLEKCLENG